MIKQIVTATSGTVNIVDTQQDVVVFQNGASLSLALTLNFPSNPADGQRIYFCSKNGVTSLSLVATVGQIIGALTGITATTPGCWIWFSDLSTWIRIR